MVEFVSTNMCVGEICRKHGILPSTSGNRRRMFMNAGKKELVGTGGKGCQRVPKGDLVQRIAALAGRACKSGNRPVAFRHGQRMRRGGSRCPQGSGPHAGRPRRPPPAARRPPPAARRPPRVGPARPRDPPQWARNMQGRRAGRPTARRAGERLLPPDVWGWGTGTTSDDRQAGGRAAFATAPRHRSPSGARAGARRPRRQASGCSGPGRPGRTLNSPAPALRERQTPRKDSQSWDLYGNILRGPAVKSRKRRMRKAGAPQ